jgi:hypothetical protein
VIPETSAIPATSEIVVCSRFLSLASRFPALASVVSSPVRGRAVLLVAVSSAPLSQAHKWRLVRLLGPNVLCVPDPKGSRETRRPKRFPFVDADDRLFRSAACRRRPVCGGKSPLLPRQGEVCPRPRGPRFFPGLCGVPREILPCYHCLLPSTRSRPPGPCGAGDVVRTAVVAKKSHTVF